MSVSMSISSVAVRMMVVVGMHVPVVLQRGVVQRGVERREGQLREGGFGGVRAARARCHDGRQRLPVCLERRRRRERRRGLCGRVLALQPDDPQAFHPATERS